MDRLYGWIQNIVYYLIFVTMIINLLPAGKYEKYLRLFAGVILILLVIQPITGGLRLEDNIAGIFKTLSFENEAGELKAKLDGMEARRLDELVKRYEASAAEDIERMVSLDGVESKAVSVEINREEGSSDFGKIKRISVILAGEENSAGEKGAGENRDGEKGAGENRVGENRVGENRDGENRDGENRVGENRDGENRDGENRDEKNEPEEHRNGAGGQEVRADSEGTHLLQEKKVEVKTQVEKIEPVDPVTIGGGDAEGPLSSKVSAPGAARNGIFLELQREIASYYQVEEQYVEIRMEDE